jgi:hypothetical protein
MNHYLSPVDGLRRDVIHALTPLRARIDAIETTLVALAPLKDSDRMELARVCQAKCVTPKEIDCRAASAGRARKVNQVFQTLRQKGWSLDRIAKATGYSTRGVASNLEKFSQSAVQETGHTDGQKSQTGQTLPPPPSSSPS